MVCLAAAAKELCFVISLLVIGDCDESLLGKVAENFLSWASELYWVTLSLHGSKHRHRKLNSQLDAVGWETLVHRGSLRITLASVPSLSKVSHDCRGTRLSRLAVAVARRSRGPGSSGRSGIPARRRSNPARDPATSRRPLRADAIVGACLVDCSMDIGQGAGPRRG